MSTRANIHFTFGSGELAANIYRHSDGYPEGVLPDLAKFFDAVEEQVPGDTRFNDPEYLAAKFVVWQAYAFHGWTDTGDAAPPLDFLSVGIQLQDAGDAAYTYTVTCHGDGRPKVTHREA